LSLWKALKGGPYRRRHLAIVFDGAANLIPEQSQQAQHDLIPLMVPTAKIDLNIPVGSQGDVGDHVASA